jgi:hypothetical protein
VEFQVGATNSLFVRFERQATPEHLELHLHWEVEVDGRPIVGTTHVHWHEDDWDQDAAFSVTPTRHGEVRLTRFSVAFVPRSNPTKVVLMTVRDLPLSFRVKEARGTGAVQNVIQVQGTGNAISFKSEVSQDQADTSSALDLSRRRLHQSPLVKEVRPEWWARRRHVLLTSYSGRALLSWRAAEGTRCLIICYQPARFGLGRQREGNQFVLRWSPSRPDVDHENVNLSRSISRQHLAVELTSAQINVCRLSAATFVPKAVSRPQIGANGQDQGRTVCEAMTVERKALHSSDVFYLGGLNGSGSDGLQVRLTALTNPGNCAVLVERLNNRSNLAYLGLIGPTRLSGAGYFQGLPKDLTVEWKNGLLELQGNPTTDLGCCGVEFRECHEDEFLD